MSKQLWPVLASLAAMSLAAVLLLTGCELSGEYEDDNVTVRFGNTNRTVQVSVRASRIT